MSTRVAVVTGSNKGIGFGIVKILAKQFDGVIYLTARNEDLGHKSLAQAKSETGSESIRFHQLDITDSTSISRFHDYLLQKYDGLDILINNAGIAYKMASTAPFGEQAEVTCATNFTATLNLCRKLFPLLKPHARVCNVSSRAGMLSLVSNDNIKKKLISDNLTMEELVNIMDNFVKFAKAGTHRKYGYPNSAYGMSKVGLTAMTRVLQREIDSDPSKEDIVITSCCPGYVDTDMTSHKGPLTIEQGAETPVYLALLPPGWNGARGRFFCNKREMEWAA